MRWKVWMAIVGLGMAGCRDALPPAGGPQVRVPTEAALDLIPPNGVCPNCVFGPKSLARRDGVPYAEYTQEFRADPAADYMVAAKATTVGARVEVFLNGTRVVSRGETEVAGAEVAKKAVPRRENRLTMRVYGPVGASATVAALAGVGAVGSAGGTIRVPNGLARLVIPAGALTATTTITIGQASAPPGIDPTFAPVGPVLDLQPSGLSFAKPVSLIVRAPGSGDSTLRTHIWEYLPASNFLVFLHNDHDTTSSEVTARLNHFSQYWWSDWWNPPLPPGTYTYGLTDAPALVSQRLGEALPRCTFCSFENDMHRAVGQWGYFLSGAGVTFTHSQANPQVDIRAMTRSEANAFYGSDVLGVGDGVTLVDALNPSRRHIVLNDGVAWWLTEMLPGRLPLQSWEIPSSFEATLLHEFGHVVGLEHPHNLVGYPPVMADGALMNGPVALACNDLFWLSYYYLPWLPGISNRCASAVQLDSGPGAGQRVAIGGAVSPSPSVRVVDGSGRPVGNITVLFWVKAGAGSVTGAVATTNAQGVAAVTSWRPAALGTNILRAEVIDLGANAAVDFDVTVVTASSTSSLQLDGIDDYADVPSSTLYDVDNLTVEAWIRLDQDVTAVGARPVNRQQGGTGGWGIEVAANGQHGSTSPNQLLFYTGQCTTNYTVLETQVYLAPQRWYHVAATYDGLNQRVYLDGVLVASGQSTLGLCKGASIPIVFGRHGGVNTYYWPGAIDDVRIWGVARSATDIARDTRASLTGSELGLLGLWHFDEGVGTSAADATPNRRTATLRNGAGWRPQTW